MLLPPDAFASQFIEPHSISMPVQGHAAAAGHDTTAIYRALYSWLAERWIVDGFFVHNAHITPGDAEVQEAWVSLGFGRKLTCGVRDTGPVADGSSGRVEVHQASQEDIDVIVGLSQTLSRHHATSPMFWPLLAETDEATRDFLLGLLADPTNAHFVAYEDGRPIGMDTFMGPGFIPSIVELDRNVYLFEGVVEPDARSGGIGKALLEHSMAWAREQGYQLCTLHFASGNPSGGPFWLSQGFEPVEYTMQRRVDERIAWAHA
jgi:GNAT superfamily N-acetyltransferase